MKGQLFNSRVVVHCIDLGMNAWHVADVSAYVTDHGAATIDCPLQIRPNFAAPVHGLVLQHSLFARLRFRQRWSTTGNRHWLGGQFLPPVAELDCLRFLRERID